jgi:hypothetical protein
VYVNHAKSNGIARCELICPLESETMDLDIENPGIWIMGEGENMGSTGDHDSEKIHEVSLTECESMTQ